MSLDGAQVAKIFETMDYGPALESDGQAEQWLEERARRFGHFIDGDWTDPEASETFETSNPARSQRLAAIAQGSRQDVDAAVKAARRAVPGWTHLSGFERAKYLYALARLIQRAQPPDLGSGDPRQRQANS